MPRSPFVQGHSSSYLDFSDLPARRPLHFEILWLRQWLLCIQTGFPFQSQLR